ncbi:MAG: methyltransferase, partial [Ruminococcus bromii]
KIRIVNSDLNKLDGALPLGSFDLVACNPPYKISGGGITNPENAKLVARHESECTLDDVCRCGSSLLQFGGRLCICQRPERLADAMEAMRKYSVEPKKLRLVQQRKSKAPKLFLLEGRRGGKRGFLEVMPTLFIEDESGNFSEEMLNIYGSYKEDYIN